MNIYPIVVYENSLLRKRSEEISKGYPHIEEFIDDLLLTMHRARGLGISAVQVGVPIRLFVIDYDNGNNKFAGVFINPKIIREFGDTIELMESCLSIPTIQAPVKRPSSIELEWYDRKWKKQTKVFTGFEARVIQHEYDHLEGVLYIDKISNIWKQMLDVPLEMIKNKEIKTNYLQR